MLSRFASKQEWSGVEWIQVGYRWGTVGPDLMVVDAG